MEENCVVKCLDPSTIESKINPDGFWFLSFFVERHFSVYRTRAVKNDFPKMRCRDSPSAKRKMTRGIEARKKALLGENFVGERHWRRRLCTGTF